MKPKLYIVYLQKKKTLSEREMKKEIVAINHINTQTPPLYCAVSPCGASR